MRPDIQSPEDIKWMVDQFYAKVRQNELLGPIFENVIQDNWPTHLDKMYRFWQTVLLGEHLYNGSPFLPHASLPIEKVHFETWLHLFKETVDTHFEGHLAAKAKSQAQRMAQMFENKIDYYRHNPSQPLL